MLIASGRTVPVQSKTNRQIVLSDLQATVRRRGYRGRSGFSCSCRKRLQIVFVTTEVAPWSKVGGLADVLAGLPVALAARGHKVMTVAPRYRPYENVVDTGVSAPVELPPVCTQFSKPSSTRTELNITRKFNYVRYFDCHDKGVHRVFVDHPLYVEADSIYGGVSSYTEGATGNSLDLRFSILCQAALAAPVLLWDDCHIPESVETCRDTASMTCSNGKATAGMPSDVAFACSSGRHGKRDHETMREAGVSAVDRRGIVQPDLNELIDNTAPPSSNGLAEQPPILFVGNDWPCAPAILRLKHVVQAKGVSYKAELFGLQSKSEANRSIRKCDIVPARHSDSLKSAAEVDDKQIRRSTDRKERFKIVAQYVRDWIALREKMQVRLARSRIVFCIHNLAYQGRYPQDAFHNLCLPSSARAALACQCVKNKLSNAHPDREAAVGGLEIGTPGVMPLPCGGQNELNWMKAAISECSLTLTVSPTYAHEIATSQLMGQGLHGIILSKGIRGIMNGIDVEVWNPADDSYLPPRVRYTRETAPVRKVVAKLLLQARLGLVVDASQPLFGFVGRLTDQKGIDVLLSACPTLLSTQKAARQVSEASKALMRAVHFPRSVTSVQLVMLGTGGMWEENAVRNLQSEFPGKAVGLTAFDESIAHWMYAACDFMILPSRFEPCGLVAQCAVRYGAVPLVTAVGGLKDLVTKEIGYTIPALGATGDPLAYRKAVDGLVSAVHLAAAEYRTPKYYILQRNCMSLDVSWDKSARLWEQALESLV